ncbi:MAG: nucleotidyltransferase domain-containing protein [bacterium]|nr:nucleotidyltransferase domain-containing protein [bacterium]
MIDRKDIEDAVKQIIELFRPERVILFGSYAYGTPHEDSDVDCMVILPFDGKPVRKAAEIATAIKKRFPLDILVQSPDRWEARLHAQDPFIVEINEHGIEMYRRMVDGRGVSR